MSDFREALAENAKAVTQTLDRFLFVDDEIPEKRLTEAMRYVVLAGGKRVRPFLVTASSGLFNVSESSALRTAAAVEMVHCYSLVHDDLPAMDNDDLRRGQPTCHIKYDEATAILAGDALLTKAFEILASPATHSDPKVCCELIAELAKAIGEEGMVGGQMLDLLSKQWTLGKPEVTRLQRMKTGELIAVSCEAGAILGKAPETVRLALRAYAHDLGLAFQIADDLLDVEGNEADVGKKTGKDEAAGKATFISILGVENARKQAGMLAGQAAQHLDIFDEKADSLRKLAQFVVERRS
ncbi:MAG: polyprenyl synthetase family protein [Rhodospirillales bacterium]|jgi:farnesyl diphosphate synthase|nr:polyprenyl synthetase family protein [Rhodospirillales bacterium]HJN23131.1 farnesyl diphosphate synthase [Rhodospirillales bacterium]